MNSSLGIECSGGEFFKSMKYFASDLKVLQIYRLEQYLKLTNDNGMVCMVLAYTNLVISLRFKLT